MNCAKCNAELEEGAKTCCWCGAKNPLLVKKVGMRKRYIILMAAIVGIISFTLFIILTIHDPKNQSTNNPRDLSGIISAPAAMPTKTSQNTKTTNVIPTVMAQNSDNANTDPKGIAQNSSNIASNVTPTNSATNFNSSEGSLADTLPYLYYMKGNRNTIYRTLADQPAPEIIVNKFKNDEEINNKFYMSEDSKRIVYLISMPIKLGAFNEEKYEMFYCDLTSDNKQIYKIDSDVTRCKINVTGTKIYYLKDDNLYMSDISGKEKIADNISEFYIDKIGEWTMYRTKDDYSYIRKDKDKVYELGTGITLHYISEDFNIIYYTQNKSLHLLRDKNVNERLATGVARVIQIYDTGQIYYLYDNASEYLSANLPGNIRNMIGNKLDDFGLYYYSEGKSELINEHCLDAYCGIDRGSTGIYRSGECQPVMVYTTINDDSAESTDPYIEGEKYVCEGSKTLGQLGKGDLYSFTFDQTDNRIYYLQRNKNNQSNVLYYVTLNDSILSKIKVYAKNVDLFWLEGNSVLFYKNFVMSTQSGWGDLYLNNKKIESDMDQYSIQKNDNTDYYVGITGQFCTLKLYHNGEIKKIADNVSDYVNYKQYLIVYVKMDGNGTNDLYMYNGSNNDVLIDHDIVGLLKPNITEYGYANGG